MDASEKKRENQSSSNTGNKQRTSTPRQFQGQGRYYQGQGQGKATSRIGAMTCYHCHQPGHLRWDYTQRQGFQSVGTPCPSHEWDAHGHRLSLLSLVWVGGNSISRRVLRKHLLQHRQAREARVWVEVGDKAHRSRLRRPRGVSTLLYHRLSQQISQLFRVCFYSRANEVRVLFDSIAYACDCVCEFRGRNYSKGGGRGGGGGGGGGG